MQGDCQRVLRLAINRQEAGVSLPLVCSINNRCKSQIGSNEQPERASQNGRLAVLLHDAKQARRQGVLGVWLAKARHPASGGGAARARARATALPVAAAAADGARSSAAPVGTRAARAVAAAAGTSAVAAAAAAGTAAARDADAAEEEAAH